jgi:hypothetical protein
MAPKPREHLVSGDANLLRRLAAEEPEFIIEDATSSGSVPPADSSEAKDFISAAEVILKQLSQSPEQNGRNGNSETPDD